MPGTTLVTVACGAIAVVALAASGIIAGISLAAAPASREGNAGATSARAVPAQSPGPAPSGDQRATTDLASPSAETSSAAGEPAASPSAAGEGPAPSAIGAIPVLPEAPAEVSCPGMRPLWWAQSAKGGLDWVCADAHGRPAAFGLARPLTGGGPGFWPYLTWQENLACGTSQSGDGVSCMDFAAGELTDEAVDLGPAMRFPMTGRSQAAPKAGDRGEATYSAALAGGA